MADGSSPRHLAFIQPASQTWLAKAREHQNRLTKPPGSLGMLEDIGNRLCSIQQTFQVTVRDPAVLIFAADHGVCEEGVNVFPQSVTQQMLANFSNGGAAINQIAATVGATLRVLDVGVGKGTCNMVKQEAMTAQQMAERIEAGRTAAAHAIRGGANVLALGEMGIGNTTSAAAVCAALTGIGVESVCGPGTGADAAGIVRKQSVVSRALARHAPYLNSPFDILQCLGGFELAAIVGACIESARQQVSVLLDGFIATAAAALACQLQPNIKDFLFAGHLSTEPGHALLLQRLQLDPILVLQLRLGEGTGAALAINILRAAAATFSGMATFESAGVSGRS